MTNHLRKLLILPLALTIGLSACGGGGVSTAEQAHLKQLQKDPAVQKVEATFKSRNRKCFKGLKTFSKQGFREYMGCIAPPSQKAQAKACLDRDLKANGFPHSKKQIHLHMTYIANCIVKEPKK
jgi:hypothetical protein